MYTVLNQPLTHRRRRLRQACSLTEDRERAQADRVAAKTDRHRLADVPLSSSEREAATDSASHAAVERFDAAGARDHARKARELERHS
jgi:hypothetical protein